MRFAEVRGDGAHLPQQIASYSLPVACYPGQESRYEGKVQNLSMALAHIDGVLVRPGETLSFWHLVGRPTHRAGYAPAAALRSGRLTEEVGGSICLASTVLYSAGLLSGMNVIERYCHSVDTYGDARYFELGRDAAVEYAYRDLRMRNAFDVPLLIRAGVADGRVLAETWSSEISLSVRLDIGPVRRVPGDARGPAAIEVRTERTVCLGGNTRNEDLGVSRHEVPFAETRDPDAVLA